jgi:HAE1 family hydrophobic/amphiphilic exporter-1
MIQSLIDRLTRRSIRHQWVTIGISALLLIAGIIAAFQLKLELIPPIEFPQTLVMASNPGAETQETLQQVTIPLENAVKGVEGVVNVESTTQNSMVFITVRNKFGLDQGEIRAEIQKAVDGLDYPEGMEKPELLTFSFDDLPIAWVSVSSSNLDLKALKVLVDESIIPALKNVEQIADVQLSGGQELPQVENAGQQMALAQEPTPEPSPASTAMPTKPAGSEGTANSNPLPASWQLAGKAQKIELNSPDDVTPEMIQALAKMAPQLLNDLTPENLRGLSPEVLAWLPVDFVNTLDEALRNELDALAQPAGGLSAKAVAAAAAAAELAANAPALSGIWIEPAPDGTPSQLKTAADLIYNGFFPTAAEYLNAFVASSGEHVSTFMRDLTPDVILWLNETEGGFLANLEPVTLRLFSPEVLGSLPEAYLSSIDPALRNELEGIAAGTIEVFIPTSTINRVDGNPSLSLAIYKDGEANIVTVSHRLFNTLDKIEKENPGLRFDIVFEQASFIEESISGVVREGGLGAVFAVIIILLFLSGMSGGRYRLSWRSTLVTGVSIPLSIFIAFALMKWLPPAVALLFKPLANATAGIPVLGAITLVLYRLFPEGMTLNIMTLSGMTVAIGRVIDDSIVVLENIYRHIQHGEDRKEAVLVGTRDVAIAILASTVTTVVVFLPIGVIGGLIGEFFLPFGIAVTYALGASFLVAVTIVPLLAYLFIRKEHLPEEKETSLQRAYTPVLKWALKNKASTLAIATVLFLASGYLLTRQPRAFLPNFGEQQLSVSVKMPNGTSMVETNAAVAEFETTLKNMAGLGVIQTEIGSGGGMSSFFGGGVDQAAASLTIGFKDLSRVKQITDQVRQAAVEHFGEENVTVSSGSMSGGAFGGFSLVLSGNPDQLAAFNSQAIQILEDVNGLTNVSSNLSDQNQILRVDGEPAVRFSAELETSNSLGVIAEAKKMLEKAIPIGLTVSEGFESQQQTQGFAQAIQALLISIIAVYLVMIFAFRSFIHPLTILFSLPLAIIGAAIALWITHRVVGLSAMVGLMMLVGIVVTNAIILVDRVQRNRTIRGLATHEALIEAGRTRLRPILMTATATILALMPLALGFNQGAIIAADLATVVIGGLFTSTMLTLLVVPVMFSLLDRVTMVRMRGKK